MASAKTVLRASPLLSKPHCRQPGQAPWGYKLKAHNDRLSKNGSKNDSFLKDTIPGLWWNTNPSSILPQQLTAMHPGVDGLFSFFEGRKRDMLPFALYLSDGDCCCSVEQQFSEHQCLPRKQSIYNNLLEHNSTAHWKYSSPQIKGLMSLVHRSRIDAGHLLMRRSLPSQIQPT